MGLFLQYAWLIPLFPLLGFAIITLTPIRLSRAASGWLAIGLMVAATVVALGVGARCAGRACQRRWHGRGDGARRPRARGRGRAGFAFPAANIVQHVPLGAGRWRCRVHDGLLYRPGRGGDAGDGDDHLDLHPPVLAGLHGPRRAPVALLLVYLAVHRRDAADGDGQQPAAVLHGLGADGPVLVPADRLLVRQGLRRPTPDHAAPGGDQSVHHHPRRRCAVYGRPGLSVDAGRLARFRRRRGADLQPRVSGAYRRAPPMRWASAWRPGSRCCCSPARSASRRSSRCMSGCRTRWKGRRPSRR